MGSIKGIDKLHKDINKKLEDEFDEHKDQYFRNDAIEPVAEDTEKLMTLSASEAPPQITPLTSETLGAIGLRKDKILFEDGDLGLEHMAEVVHEVWCMWMRYLFTKGWALQDKGFKIDTESVSRWKRQMNTPYAQLSEDEKQSDRDIARRYLNIAWLPDKINEGRRSLIEEEDGEIDIPLTEEW